MAKAKSKKAPQVLPVDVAATREANASFNFPPGEVPKGFTNLTVEDTVTLTVTGKVTRLTQERDWGSDLSLAINKVTID